MKRPASHSFGAQIYSNAFKEGLKGSEIEGVEVCGMFGDIELGGCDQAVKECDANPNPNGCKHSVGKWWDQQMAELEVLHKKQLPQVARAIAEAACGEEFAVSVTLSTANAPALVTNTVLLSGLKDALVAVLPGTSDLQEAVATPRMLTLSASFDGTDGRAAACSAYPAWKAALTPTFFERLASSLPALAAYEITDPFVSKHMRKTPNGT